MTWRAIKNALAGLLAGVAGGVLLGALIVIWGVTVAPAGDGALAVSGLPAAQVGAVAAAAGITVLELATGQASLEDAFVDLTQDVVEFRAAARPAAGPTPEEEK